MKCQCHLFEIALNGPLKGAWPNCSQRTFMEGDWKEMDGYGWVWKCAL